MLRAGVSTSIATRQRVPSQNQQRRGFLNVKVDRKASFEEAVRTPPKWVPFGDRPVEGSAEWKWWIRRFKRNLPKGRTMPRSQLSLKNPFLPDKSLAQKLSPELIKGNLIPDPKQVSDPSQKYTEDFVSFRVGFNAKFCADFRTNQHHINYNAVDLPMLRTLRQYFDKWEKSGFYTSVLWTPSMLHAGQKENLCTGADLWSLVDSKQRAKTFYREQAELIYEASVMKKPVVTLMHGRSHGLGAGLALFQLIPIATPSSIVSSPGGRYGMSGADAGLSYLFSRLPGRLGEFYLLTGKNITGSDLVELGLAKFYMKDASAVNEMHEALSHNESHEIQQVLEVVKMFTAHTEPSQIMQYIDVINECFEKPDVLQIRQALMSHPVEWARSIASRLKSMDPVILTATLTLARRARFLSVAECLQAEFALACRLIDRKLHTAILLNRLNPDKYRAPYNHKALWSLSASELQTRADQLLEPLPEAERLQLNVRRNLEHYQRRPNIDIEGARSADVDNSRSDMQAALKEWFPNGKVTRAVLTKRLTKELSALGAFQADVESWYHEQDLAGRRIAESGRWEITNKETRI